jgi:thymidylate synthase
MKQYLDLLKDILENGESRDDRTETGVLSSFGHQLRFNLQDGFSCRNHEKNLLGRVWSQNYYGF